jgi:transposase-like protein
MRNPFRYFNSSPEVIRLRVIMYIRYPLSLRQVETRHRDLPRNRAVLMEPVRSDVRRGDPQAARSRSIILELALAPG